RAAPKRRGRARAAALEKRQSARKPGRAPYSPWEIEMGLVLVVEDDPATREFLGYVLRREGHGVVDAASGEEALRAAQLGAPDLVILDLMLPGIDGFAVCERLRAARPAPVLMLTGPTQEADKVRGFETGADDDL